MRDSSHGSTFCLTAVGDSPLSSFKVQLLSSTPKAVDFSSLLALYPSGIFLASLHAGALLSAAPGSSHFWSPHHSPPLSMERFPLFPPTYICLSILARTPSKKSYKTPLLRVPTSLHPQFPCAHPTPCVRTVQLSVLPHQTQSSLRVETMVLIPVSTWPSNMLSIHVD